MRFTLRWTAFSSVGLIGLAPTAALAGDRPTVVLQRPPAHDAHDDASLFCSPAVQLRLQHADARQADEPKRVANPPPRRAVAALASLLPNREDAR